MIDSATNDGGVAVGGGQQKKPENTSDAWQTALLNVADMLGPVSHELHNVMNNIVLRAALLAREVPEAMRPEIAVFKSLAYQASQMLNELDGYRHQIRGPKEPVDLDRLVREIVDRYAAHGFTIESRLDPVGAALANEADAMRLLELLAAAAHAAGPPVSIRVSAGAEQGRVVVRVADHGSDVDPDKLDQLFEPFAVTRQGENTLERTACRVIARRLDAKLRATPNPDGGVVVTVEFQPAIV